MDNLNSLFKKYLDNTLTEDELQEFLNLIKQPHNSKQVNRLMDDTWVTSDKKPTPDIKITESVIAESEHSGKRKYRNWLRIAAAALLIPAGLFFYFLQQDTTAKNIKGLKEKAIARSIMPGTEKAVLILSDGSSIVLDSAHSGTITSEGNSDIVKTKDGKLVYRTNGQAVQVVYNTMVTPRGGQYRLTLSDNSRIWLNAASSIKFPNVFIGNTREVEITGEVYFEVAKNTIQPFIVKTNGTQIKVLGTHFNVMAYDDETILRTTLLEGSVEVQHGQDKQRIIPGEQAMVSKNGTVTVNQVVDIDEVMGWRNGVFKFKDTDIRSIMRQISRWYDADVEFVKDVNKSFTGMVSRKVSIKEMITFLESTKAVHFKIENTIIKVMP